LTSRRIPSDFEPNELTKLLEEKQRSGTRVLDLTETNPARLGLGGAGPEELRALADARGARYDPDPQGMRSAREEVARYLAARPGSEQAPSPDDLFLVGSTSEAYAHLFRLLCDPGDEILVPRPSYPLFEPLAALESVRTERYRLVHDERWSLDLDSLEAAISSRTRAVVVVEPNNPTGSCLTREEAAHVESLCAERGVALVSDEVFGDFPRPPRRALPTMLGNRRALTFVLGGLSKTCGMPQMKVAWIALAGPDAERREAARGLEWIADLFLSPSTPVQAALPALLGARHAFQERLRRRLEENGARLASLGKKGDGFRVWDAEGGWAAVLETPPAGNEFALRLLEEQNVWVHPGHFYEIGHERCVVLSLLQAPEVFAEAVARMERLR